MFPRRGSPERLSRPPHVTCRRWNMALQQSWIPNFYCQVRQGWVVRFLFFSICCVFLSVHLTFLYISLVQSRVLAVVCCFLLLFTFLCFSSFCHLLVSPFFRVSNVNISLRWPQVRTCWWLKAQQQLEPQSVWNHRGEFKQGSNACGQRQMPVILY